MMSRAEARVPLPPPVWIVVGRDVDASAMPLTFQRNRVVTDMLRFYACAVFLRKNGVDDAGAVSSDVFEWFSDSLPVVGVDDMTRFHNRAYVHYLSIRETLSELDERASVATRLRAEEMQPCISRRISARLDPPPRQLLDLVKIEADMNYNLTGENSPFLGMWRTIQATLSGTLTAARLLAQPGRFAALHWFGGKHHAAESAAGGSCFVNDVVLGVYELQRLLPSFKNHVLVVNVGAHHGDGTQEAFLLDNSVLTISMHAYGVGVFPGTGGIEEIGAGLGRGFAMNIPLPVGASDVLAVPLMLRAVAFALKKMGDKLGAVVIVCGSDALCGDPRGALNLTIGGLQCVVRALLREAARRALKVLLLGAGGYVDVSCARLAGAVTRDVLSCAAAMRRGGTDYFRDSANLSQNFGVAVPEDCAHFTQYGPSFLMHALPPPRVVEVRRPPRESPLFARMRRAAEKRALRLRRKEEEESSDTDDNDEGRDEGSDTDDNDEEEEKDDTDTDDDDEEEEKDDSDNDDSHENCKEGETWWGSLPKEFLVRNAYKIP